MSKALLLCDALEGAWLENQRDVSVDEIQDELRRLDALVKEQAQEIERLRAQRVPLTEDQIDAKRYRWLRDHTQTSAVIRWKWAESEPGWENVSEHTHEVALSGFNARAFDQAVDAAMAAVSAIEAANEIHPSPAALEKL